MVLKMDNRHRKMTTVTGGGEYHLPYEKPNHDQYIALLSESTFESIRKTLKTYSMKGQYIKTMNCNIIEGTLRHAEDKKFVLSSQELEELIHGSIELGIICEKLRSIDASLSSWEKRIDARIKCLECDRENLPT